MAETQEVKGTNLVGLVKLLKRRQIFDQVVGTLDPGDQELLQERILPTSWYSYELFHRLLVTLDRVGGNGDGSFAHDLGKLAARMGSGGIYKMFGNKFFTDDFSELVSRTIWKSNYRPGQILISGRELEGDREATKMRLVAFRPASKIHCANIQGWIEGYFTAMGCGGVEVSQTSCQCEDDPECVFYIRWDRGTP